MYVHKAAGEQRDRRKTVHPWPLPLLLLLAGKNNKQAKKSALGKGGQAARSRLTPVPVWERAPGSKQEVVILFFCPTMFHRCV